ncbi:MAG TPA: M15 family metallopeptidase, partial [Sphingobacteriaceae bacterium]
MARILFFLLLVVSSAGQAQYKYGLKPMTYPEYKTAIKSNPEKELVDLEKFIPGLVLDIRYATTNNFTGTVIYNLAKAYARKPVAESLLKAQKDFNALGYGIKVFDGYRPYKATVKFYEVYKDTTYVASPYRGSRHNRGCAIDMTIVDLKTGKDVPMPTE